ncbi:MAG: TolC family protein [Lachnospiraceae bacterium]|nr:TolC family protein [Lachnospiraceae bacterium]
MRKDRRKKRILLFAGLVLVLLSAFLSVPMSGKAAPGTKRLTMKAARALALQESLEYFQVEQQIQSKEAALKSAQKAIKLKQKNMSTFRWSPLLNFQFPTRPTEAESLEFQFKPVSIQAEIDEAKHKLGDTKLAIYEEVNNIYVAIVVLQRTIAFNEERIKTLEDGLARNQARLLIGEATQADVDSISKKLDSTQNTVAADKRTLDANLRKLGKKIGLDITTGYTFETPFLDAKIPRTQLVAFVQFTLDNSQEYYKACLDEMTARAELNTNFNLMKGHYGSDINMIASYVTQALNGKIMSGSELKGFKQNYDAFLKQVDSYWEGKKKILFIKIPKLWFKGALDGVRYIEDDPYVLYQATLDYASARSAQIETESTIETEVIDGFENYVSIRNAYMKNIEDLEKAEKDLEADRLLNRIGELSFDELNSEEEDYEELQNSFFELMKTYSVTMYSYDRLTCGAVSAYFDGTNASLQAGQVGTSYVEKEYADGASYYLRQIIQSEAFELVVHIPEDFEVEVTHYELWCDNVLIGGRKPVAESLRHLALTTQGIGEAKIRFYNGEEFVDDVIIDPSESSGPLPIVSERRIVKIDPDEIGRYECTTNSITGLTSFTFTVTEEPEAAYYRLRTDAGVYLTGEEAVKNGKSFTHLPLIESGLDTVTVEVLDKDKTKIMDARIDVTNHRIKRITQ